MSQYILNIIHNNQTQTIRLSSNQTVKIPAKAGARYQILNEQGVLIFEPKVKEMGADLWVFLDGAQDTLPEIVIEGYGNFVPITNDLNLMQMDATLALQNTPSSMPLMPTDSGSLPEVVAQTASEVSTSEPMLATPAQASPALATTSANTEWISKAVLGGLGLLTLGGLGAAASHGGGDDHQPPTEPTPPTPTPMPPAEPVVHIHSIAGDNIVNAKEATEPVTILGSVSGANDGDVVNVYVDGEQIGVGRVQNGEFHVVVQGAKLASANMNNVRVAVRTENEYGSSVGVEEAYYRVQTDIEQPVRININSIADDNRIDAHEAASKITVSGSVSGARDGDKVTIYLGNQAIGHGEVNNGTFAIQTNQDGAALAKASSKTIRAEVLATDDLGNQQTVSTSHDYTVAGLAAPKISDIHIAGDGMLDATEAMAKVPVSGSVSGARDGDKVTIYLGNQAIGTGDVHTGKFTVNVDGAALAKASSKTVRVEVLATDALGNQTAGTASQNYTTATLAAPKISDIHIAGDGLLDATEAMAKVPVSGSVSGARDGDKVTIYLGNQAIGTGDVHTGKFTVNVDGAALAKASSKTVRVEVLATDALGNQTAGDATQDYTTATNLPQPTVSDIHVTSDNTLNEMEAANTVAISGKVNGARDGDAVNIYLGQQEIGTGKVHAGEFTVEVNGATLAQADDKTVRVAVTATDVLGNQAVGDATQSYTLTTLTAPEIHITQIAGDGVLNAAEVAGMVSIEGSVKGANASDSVEILLGGTVIATAQVHDEAFSVSVSGEQLARADMKTITARIQVHDMAGNSKTSEISATYTVQTEAVPAKITIHDITADNIINASEAMQPDITVSGSVSHVSENSKVEIWLDGKVVATTSVLADGTFTQFVSGDALAHAKQPTVTVTVNGTDSAGNPVNAQEDKSYDVHTDLAKPIISLNKIAEDGVINGNEAQQDIVISGLVVSGAKEGDKVIILQGNQIIDETTVQADGTFSSTVAGSALINVTPKIIQARVETHDEWQNTATGNAWQIYDVVSKVATPEITLNPITHDMVINAQETAGMVTISGKTTASPNSVVELFAGNHKVGVATVVNGRFIANVAGKDLAGAETTNLMATVTQYDEWGNTASASASQDYTVKNQLPMAEITLNPIAGDGTLNQAEFAAGTVAISGSVQGARDGDTVVVFVGDQRVGETVVNNGLFTRDVPTSTLASADTTMVRVEVLATDEVGNSATASRELDYRVRLEPESTPLISLDNVTEDNVINLAESAKVVLVSGKVSNIQPSDKIEILLGDDVVGTVYANAGVFQMEIDGERLAGSPTKRLTARVQTTDENGNTATAQSVHDYQVDIVPPDATVSLDPIAPNNVLNADMSAHGVLISGSTSGAKAGDSVNVLVDGKSVGMATVGDDGVHFHITIDGTDLAEVQGERVLTAKLTTQDEAGNQTISSTERYFTVDTIAPTDQEVMVTIDPLTGDDVLNTTDDVQGMITISGKTDASQAGHTMTLTVGNTSMNTTVQADGRFSAEISGSVLAQSTVIDARLDATDAAGNHATLSFQHHYQVISLPEPVVSNILVTDDNLLNEQEAQGNVRISGEVMGARDDDVVRILLDNHEIGTAKVVAGRFEVSDVSGKMLAAANTKTVSVEVIATDDAGNRSIGKADSQYIVSHLDVNSIRIQVMVTEDNVISQAEASSMVVVSGSVSGGARAGDLVTVYLGQGSIGETHLQDDGTFSLSVSGATLASANAHTVRVEVLASDEAHNQKTVSVSHDYQVIQFAPDVKILAIAGNDYALSADEAAMEYVSVSGSVRDAQNDDQVTVWIGEQQIGTGVVRDGAFSVNVKPADLVAATDKTVRVTVSASNSYHDTATVHAVHGYDLTPAEKPTVSINNITDDNKLNEQEATQTIAISGSVSGAKENDTVKVWLGSQEIGTGTLHSDGTFSIDVAGETLAKASVKSITVTVSTQDWTGASLTGESTKEYQYFSLETPTISIEHVAGDDAVDAEEAKGEVSITGKTSAPDGSEITAYLDGENIGTAKAQHGAFSVTVSGERLAQANHKTVEIRVVVKDDVGNEKTAPASFDYQVLLAVEEPQPPTTEEPKPPVQPPVEQPPVEQPPVEQPPVEQPPVEQPPVEQPPVEQPPVEQPPVEQPTVEQPKPDPKPIEPSDQDNTFVDPATREPSLTLDKISGDGVINETEARDRNVVVTGSVNGVANGATVFLFLGDDGSSDDSSSGYEAIVNQGKFSYSISVSELKYLEKQIITAKATSVNGVELSSEQTYRVIDSVPMVRVELDSIANDNILNLEESKQDVIISGSVSKDEVTYPDVPLTESVKISIGNKVYNAEVHDGKFALNVSPADLIANHDKEVKAVATIRDDYGNSASSAEVKQAYSVDLQVPQVSITINNITNDNIINAEEAKLAKIPITGNVSNAQQGNKVMVTVGTETVEAEVQKTGLFTVEMSGAVLSSAADKQVHVRVEATSPSGNTVTVSDTHSYQVVNGQDPIVNIFRPIANDNIINRTEAMGKISIIGTVENAQAGDTVEITLNGKTVSGQVDAMKGFALIVNGADLVAAAHDGAGQVTVNVHTQNGLTGSSTVDYRVNVSMPEPEITINPITANSDDVINQVESYQKDTIVSGSVKNVREDDDVTIYVGKQKFEGNVHNGVFSIPVDTKALVEQLPHTFTVEVRATDDANNSTIHRMEHSYQVQTTIDLPSVQLDMVADDGIISAAELHREIHITGTTTNAGDGSTVTLFVGQQVFTGSVQNNHFDIPVQGIHFLDDDAVSVNLKAVDSAGNEQYAGAQRNYVVDAGTDDVKILMNPITPDNVVNSVEIQNPVPFTGRVLNRGEGRKISIFINQQRYTGELNDEGMFSVLVDSKDVQGTRSYYVSVQKEDNTFIGEEKSYRYDVDVSVTPPKVTINPATFQYNDLQGKVILSGTVAYDIYDVPNNQVDMTITSNGKSFKATVSGQKWYAQVDGSELNAHWGENALSIETTVTDKVGNTASSTQNGTYTAQLSQVVIDPITEDNLINEPEGQNESLTVTGHVLGQFKAGDQVRFQYLKETYTAEVKDDGTFSIDLPMSYLSANTTIGGASKQEIRTEKTLKGVFTATDGAGEHHEIAVSHDYVVKRATPLRIMLSDNGNAYKHYTADDLASDTISFSGKVVTLYDDNDLQSTYTIQAEVNGHLYYAESERHTGRFTLHIPRDDLLALPVADVNEQQGYEFREFDIRFANPTDSYGNTLDSISVFTLMINKDVVAQFSHRAAAHEMSEHTLLSAGNEADAVFTLSDAHHQPHDVRDAFYRSISAVSPQETAHDDAERVLPMSDAQVQQTAHTLAESAIPEHDGEHAQALLPETPNVEQQNAYVYHAHTESEYEVMDDVSPADDKAVAISEADTANAHNAQETAHEWQIVDQHDLTETHAAHHDVSDDSSTEWTVIGNALPSLLDSEPSAAANSETVDKAQTEYVVDTATWHPSDEWLNQAHHLI